MGGNPFTYALGRLALWTRREEFSGNLTIDTLANASFRRLAMANPRLAPYGVAARETLETMGLWESMQPRIVLGENVGQTFAMVETRNAELGLISALRRPRLPVRRRLRSRSGAVPWANPAGRHPVGARPRQSGCAWRSSPFCKHPNRAGLSPQRATNCPECFSSTGSRKAAHHPSTDRNFVSPCPAHWAPRR